ncbi:GntR family transcriptional regulator [Microbacterium sp. BR1]|uniref:GntR family transcriptional regulator n=2 Tax=unclassified Microbacterium TaxID=2609290 RepID=UPI000C2B863B|nr:GntR family transcriptional regulator [Microbacterium sp. BR1]
MSNMAVTRHPPIRDQIAGILRSAIVSLEFAPGQLLVERNLCELTQASRPSVREALRQLEAEGLVESQNGRGTIVRVISAEEAAQVYEVRAELEGLAARLFTERATAEQSDALRSALRELATAIRGEKSSKQILDAQADFYRVLFEGSGNPFLERTVQGMQVRIAQLRATTLAVPGRAAASLDEFEQIFERISTADAEGARQAAVEHVRRAGEAMARSRPAI